MKKGLLFIAILCFVSAHFNVYAQQNDNNRRERFENFQKERKEFISKAMQLKDADKKAFWALADELQMKKFELNQPLREEMRKIHRAKRNNETVAEADYKKAIELAAQLRIKEAQLDQEYLSKLLKIVSAEQVFLFQEADNQFGRRMINQRRNRD
jgi:Spy/CpxP family protein refolding chaperone